jgi:N-acetylneuraminic acid mutarotase
MTKGKLWLLALTSVLFGIQLAQADYWESRAPGPGRRVGNSTVVTGTEVIVWGGGSQSIFFNDGGRYNPANDTWTPTSQVNAPAGRWFHSAVWTGKEMIVWGGRANFFPENNFNDGGRYNPATDTWTPISTDGAPSPRSQMTAIWTGNEMIVWGGTGDAFDEKADGARYNPETDTWTPLPPAPLAERFGHTAVWTGTEMIIFGGLKVDGYLYDEHWSTFGDGARYNPVSNTWTPLNPHGAPSSRVDHSAVWTGTEMLVWGGRYLPDYTFLNSGAAYDPVRDSWTPIATQNAPEPRAQCAAVWSGHEMIVWGGYVDPSPTEINTGGRYNPVSKVWTPTTLNGAAEKRYFARSDSSVWTGQAMFIYGGWADYPWEVNLTDLYYPTDGPVIEPQQDFWEARSDGVAPRIADARVFTGDEVIVWGGGRQSTWLNDGARYDLKRDIWRPISQVNAPSGRWYPAAVWTGSEMLVWGGRANFFPYDHQVQGGRYNPQNDRWRAINTAGAPTTRTEACAVWTGSEMLVWGGVGDGAAHFSDGGRYDPQRDSWSPMAPAPLEARFDATAVWTGTEMIIFGGLKVEGIFTPNELWTSFADGARYNPATDTWKPISANGGPGSRTSHSAIWTGTEMLIWGGRSLPVHTFLNSGASYNPATDSWTPMSSERAPQARAAHGAVWTGSEMIVWGGYIDPSPFEINTGARYNPVTKKWTATTQVGAPQKRYFGHFFSALWTGQAMFIHGGWDYPQELNSTYLYYPETANGSVAEIIRVLEDANLARNDLRPLLETLEAALQAFQRGNTTAGVNHLEVFQRKVSGRLAEDNPTLAAALIAAAQEIIDSLGSN